MRRHWLARLSKTSLMSTSRLCAVVIARSNLLACASFKTTEVGDKSASGRREISTRFTTSSKFTDRQLQAVPDFSSQAQLVRKAARTRIVYPILQRPQHLVSRLRTCSQVYVATACVFSSIQSVEPLTMVQNKMKHAATSLPDSAMNGRMIHALLGSTNESAFMLTRYASS